MTAFERLVLSFFYLAPWKDLSASRRYETLEKRGYREKGGYWKGKSTTAPKPQDKSNSRRAGNERWKQNT